MTNEARELIAECRAVSVRTAFPRTRIFEWLGRESGLQALVNISELGAWDDAKISGQTISFSGDSPA